MKRLFMICIAVLIIGTGCVGNEEQKSEKKTESNTSTEMNTKQPTEEEVREEIREYIYSQEFKTLEKNEKKIKLEELLGGYVNRGLIHDFELDINKERPCFAIKFSNGREDVFLLEGFPENQN